MSDAESSQPPESERNLAHAATESRQPRWIVWVLRWGWISARTLGLVLLIAWAMLVIHFSNLPWPWTRFVLSVAFVAFAIHALWIARRREWRWALAAALVGIAVWFVLIPPSNNRPWRAEVTNPPRAFLDGDRVRFTNFRNFKYRSRDDFDVRYEERDVDVSRVVSIDFIVSHWNDGPIAHTFLSFNLDDGSPPVCISIEARPEVGERFAPLPAMFKQFELFYVVGDERDIIRVRTNYRNEQVFVYRVRATPETARAMFRLYLERINSLAERPEWYHLLSNNCTLNMIRYSRAVGGPHRRFEIGHFLNGTMDAYLHRLGILDASLDFPELRRRSHINDAALAAGDADDFSVRIRQPLPVHSIAK